MATTRRNDLSKAKLADLIRKEGYVSPTLNPADPELRTGSNYCAAVHSFDFVKDYLKSPKKFLFPGPGGKPAR